MYNQYRELESGYNYIDKTGCLQKEIERFPSVYIEGSAGCGKTTMMRLLLKKHPEVDYTVLWMDEADEKVIHIMWISMWISAQNAWINTWISRWTTQNG